MYVYNYIYICACTYNVYNICCIYNIYIPHPYPFVCTWTFKVDNLSFVPCNCIIHLAKSCFFIWWIISSVQFSRSVMSDSLWPHESQHTGPPCPSPTPEVYSNSCPSSWWYNPAISSSVIPFSSCPQSLPASGSFPMSQLFVWGGQNIRVSASASLLPMNTQDWSGWISLQSKGLSRVFSTP